MVLQLCTLSSASQGNFTMTPWHGICTRSHALLKCLFKPLQASLPGTVSSELSEGSCSVRCFCCACFGAAYKHSALLFIRTPPLSCIITHMFTVLLPRSFTPATKPSSLSLGMAATTELAIRSVMWRQVKSRALPQGSQLPQGSCLVGGH
jgi:hypothetical protein